MEIHSEKIGLDPEKLRQFLEQQMKDSPPQQAAATDGSTSTNPSEGPPIEFDLIP